MADENNTPRHSRLAFAPERYINPYTDFGFKRLFGTEMNKDLLVSFLDSLLGGEQEPITDVQYLNSERLGEGYGDRRAVFDVYCETSSGSKFIVEMQKAEQRFFKDRSLYYSTLPIREQAPRGNWDYRLKNVYTVGILDFVFPDNEYPDDSFRHEVKLMDVEDNHVFYDKLTFVYLEMPKFSKGEHQLSTMFDKWMYVLHNLSRLLDRPRALQDRIFTKLFEQAEIAKYTPEERREYETSVKEYRDYINTVDTAHLRGKEEGYAEGMQAGEAKGRAEGRAEGVAEGELKERAATIRRMRAAGMTTEQIAQATGLDADEVCRSGE